MGQRDGFSDYDLLKLNKLYECPNSLNAANRAPTTTVAPTTTAVVTTTAGICDNKKWQCFFWQRLNYCSSYADYMKEYCPKSCNLCPGTNLDQPNRARNNFFEQQCIDFDLRCDEWSIKGYCKTGYDSSVIQRTCPKSCGLCDSRAVRP